MPTTPALEPKKLVVPNRPAPGKKNEAPINAAPSKIYPVPPPAPDITGTICISSCPIGWCISSLFTA